MQHVAKAVARGLILAVVFALAMPVFADRAGAKIKGTISAIDLVAGAVTVTPSRGGADVTVTVDGSTVIKRNRAYVTLADLQLGDRVEVKYNPTTMVASQIEAKSSVVLPPPAPYAKVKGTVQSVDLVGSALTVTPKYGGAPVSVAVAPSTIIKHNDSPATLADIQVGDRVEVKYDPATMVAYKIEAKAPGYHD